MPDTSASLLEELRTRPSEQAWQRMVQVYDSLFRGWLTAQGVHPDDSDDLVQEILLVMMRKLPEFKHQGKPGSFRAWARQVALNCVRRSWRTKKRVPVATGDSEFLSYLNQLSDAGSELTQEWDRQHDRVVVQRLLDLIRVDSDPQLWEAFSLHVVKRRASVDRDGNTRSQTGIRLRRQIANPEPFARTCRRPGRRQQHRLIVTGIGVSSPLKKPGWVTRRVSEG